MATPSTALSSIQAKLDEIIVRMSKIEFEILDLKDRVKRLERTPPPVRPPTR